MSVRAIGGKVVAWIVRILLLLAGMIAALFVARDAVNFPIIQAVSGMLLFVALVAAIALWPRQKEH
ncbi:hypothetical protein DYH55_20215 [Methylovirgula sp. 4M-Z18]|nr:hypothetical protein DYH55_20215 [Methylovirgula sp. 4M-Z18]